MDRSQAKNFWSRNPRLYSQIRPNHQRSVCCTEVLSPMRPSDYAPATCGNCHGHPPSHNINGVKDFILYVNNPYVETHVRYISHFVFPEEWLVFSWAMRILYNWSHFPFCFGSSNLEPNLWPKFSEHLEPYGLYISVFLFHPVLISYIISVFHGLDFIFGFS